MRNLNKYLKNKIIDYDKLLKYGFIKENNIYIYNKKVLENTFNIKIEINGKENTSKIIDLLTNEEYILVDINDAKGSFVGKVKEIYEKEINSFIENCTINNVFKSKQSKEIINYIKEKYNDELEFLWDNLDAAAVRNKVNNKWYLVFMKINKSKLKDTFSGEVEIIDLKYGKEKIEKIIDNHTIFKGYHMNKKSWITICLDNSLEIEKIKKLIDNSYNLSEDNKIDNLKEKVYEYIKNIPKGKVVTYKQIAEYLGNKGLARVVGTIIKNGPSGLPYYKVLNEKGALADEEIFGKGIQKKLLEKENIEVINNKVDIEKYRY